MKKILILLFATLSFTSCSIDDDARVNVIYPLVPIETAMVPDTLFVGTESTIELTYHLPTDCHVFNRIVAEEEENILYIGVQSIYETDNLNCDESTGGTEETSFTINPNPDFESYIFKFWQGEDEEGQAQYLTEEVPVKTKGEVDV